jgi:hypothetical protein
MDDEEPQPPRSAPVFDNRTHRAYAFRRTGKGKSATGKLRWSGLGYIGTTRKPEEIAASVGVDVETVRQILAYATAHLFVEMRPETGGTGYFVMLPKNVKRPRRIPEPDDPRDDDDDEDGDDEQN